MRHNCIHLSILILIFFCGSCDNKPKSDIDYFDITQKITKYDSLYSDKNDILGNIEGIDIVNNTIIVKHLPAVDYIFSFIDINSGKLQAKWGRIGRGPNEYIKPRPGFKISGSELIFADADKEEIIYAPLSDILDKKDNPEVKKEKYPKTGDFRPFQFDIVGDYKIVLGFLAEGRFGILDSLNNIIQCPYDYPFDYGDDPKGIYRGTVFLSKIKSNDRQQKFVISTSASDVFEIYGISDSGIDRTYVSPFKHKPIATGRDGMYTVNSRESIKGITNIAASEDLICMTYSPENFAKSISSLHNTNEILCFDWNGEKVKKYILPFPIVRFCIDKDYIYGMRDYDNETILYRFKL